MDETVHIIKFKALKKQRLNYEYLLLVHMIEEEPIK